MLDDEIVSRLRPGLYLVPSEEACHLHPAEYLFEHGIRDVAAARRKLVREARQVICGQLGRKLVVVDNDRAVMLRFHPGSTQAEPS